MKDIMIRETYKKGNEEKTSWNKIGILFEANGKEYIKLFHIPNTLISVFEQKKKDESTSSQGQPATQTQPATQNSNADSDQPPF
jgi:hypothetical protein